ncbi:MAG: hypothetical protein ACYCW6_19700, partial [Candidatus Xenobia bacterium]
MDPPEIDVRGWMKLYLAGDHRSLSQQFLSTFRHYQQHQYVSLAPGGQSAVDTFVSTFLLLFTRPDFAIPPDMAETFLRLNPLIANLAAISSLRNTEVAIAMLMTQPNNVLKLLTLYSAHNTTRIERRLLFDANEKAASIWYNNFFNLYMAGLAAGNTWEHFRFHLASVDPRFEELREYHHAVFGATYVDPKQDRVLKEHVNRLLRRRVKQANVTVHNRPDPRQIGIISGSWRHGHSVHRNQYDFLARLAQKYEL